MFNLLLNLSYQISSATNFADTMKLQSVRTEFHTEYWLKRRVEYHYPHFMQSVADSPDCRGQPFFHSAKVNCPHSTFMHVFDSIFSSQKLHFNNRHLLSVNAVEIETQTLANRSFLQNRISSINCNLHWLQVQSQKEHERATNLDLLPKRNH